MGPKDIKHPLCSVISRCQPKITHLCGFVRIVSLEDVHLKIRFAAEGKVKGKRHWEGRVVFGRYCANVCHEVLLMQLVAESH